MTFKAVGGGVEMAEASSDCSDRGASTGPGTCLLAPGSVMERGCPSQLDRAGWI